MSVVIAAKGVKSMKKYKIKPYRDGFKVWKLKNTGNGCFWEDENQIFRSLKEAERYIKDKKEGDE